MAKIIGIVSAVLIIFTTVPVAHTARVASVPGEKRLFLVTAYYSPLPEQRFYIRGSYQADIRLNGRGTNGADGTEVYTGMIAAPRSYPFGTRIYIPGLGVGDVHDRGGAILAGHTYDRIDVWMGRGEEGLARALNWGARFIEGEIFWKPHQVKPGLSYFSISPKLPAHTEQRLINRTLQNPQVFAKPITRKSTEKDIKELQIALTTFGYYHGPITGKFGEKTTAAVLAFQLAEGVIPNKDAQGAGNFGPKTTATLKAKLETYNAAVEREQKRLASHRELLEPGLGKNAKGPKVEALQRMLWELGYLHGDVNGHYDSRTIDAVFEFQKKHGLVQDDWSQGAGYYGKQTHKMLASVLDERSVRTQQYPMEIQAWVPAKRTLPSIASLTAPTVSLSRQALYFGLDIEGPAHLVDEKEVFTRDLEIGMRGEDVHQLQNVLIREKCLTPGLNTAFFGNATKAALIKFQLKHKIIGTTANPGAGRAGPQTRVKLEELM